MTSRKEGVRTARTREEKEAVAPIVTKQYFLGEDDVELEVEVMAALFVTISRGDATVVTRGCLGMGWRCSPEGEGEVRSGKRKVPRSLSNTSVSTSPSYSRKLHRRIWL